MPDFKLTKKEANIMKNRRMNLNRDIVVDINDLPANAKTKMQLTKLAKKLFNNGLVVYYGWTKHVEITTKYDTLKVIKRENGTCKRYIGKSEITRNFSRLTLLSAFVIRSIPVKSIDRPKWLKLRDNNSYHLASQYMPKNEIFGTYPHSSLYDKVAADNCNKIANMLADSSISRKGLLDTYQYNDNLALIYHDALALNQGKMIPQANQR